MCAGLTVPESQYRGVPLPQGVRTKQKPEPKKKKHIFGWDGNVTKTLFMISFRSKNRKDFVSVFRLCRCSSIHSHFPAARREIAACLLMYKTAFVSLATSFPQRACRMLPYPPRLSLWSVLGSPQYLRPHLAAKQTSRPCSFIGNLFKPLFVYLFIC